MKSSTKLFPWPLKEGDVPGTTIFLLAQSDTTIFLLAQLRNSTSSDKYLPNNLKEKEHEEDYDIYPWYQIKIWCREFLKQFNESWLQIENYSSHIVLATLVNSVRHTHLNHITEEYIHLKKNIKKLTQQGYLKIYVQKDMNIRLEQFNKSQDEGDTI